MERAAGLKYTHTLARERGEQWQKMKIENLALKTFVPLALFAIGAADAFRGAWVGGPEE
jgi:hypothetical protein